MTHVQRTQIFEEKGKCVENNVYYTIYSCFCLSDHDLQLAIIVAVNQQLSWPPTCNHPAANLQSSRPPTRDHCSRQLSIIAATNSQSSRPPTCDYCGRQLANFVAANSRLLRPPIHDYCGCQLAIIVAANFSLASSEKYR